MQTAHIVDGIVREFIVPVAGFQLSDCFPAEFLAQCVQAPDDVQQGWTYDGSNFAPPVAPTPVPRTVFSAREFIQNMFTDAERQVLFTARQTNWQIDEFITLVSAGPVDVRDPQVIADIGVVESAGLLTAARAAQILAGTPA